MDKTKLSNTGMELPPLRSLDDFLLESARFQIPNLKDLDKWGNRVVNNLLYYQTNYFFMSVVIFLIVGYVSKNKSVYLYSTLFNDRILINFKCYLVSKWL